MSKVLGAILTVLGFLVFLFIVFLVLNTSASLTYNTDKQSLVESGYLIPGILSLMSLVAGLVLLFASSKEDPFVEI